MSRTLVTPRVETLSTLPSGVTKSASVRRSTRISASLANGGSLNANVSKAVQAVESLKTDVAQGWPGRGFVNWKSNELCSCNVSHGAREVYGLLRMSGVTW